MEILVPTMQAIRFYKIGTVPDWITNWPNMENVYPGGDYIAGINRTKYYNDWVVNKTMAIQLRIAVVGSEYLNLYKLSSGGIYYLYSVVNPTTITPTGWVSEKINKYEFLFDETGTYYFESLTAGYRSEKFVVHSDLKFKKRLVQIEYSNTVNDYGMVFDNNGVSVYTGLAYFTGQLLLGSPKNEISALKSDRGQLVKLRSTPIRQATLKILDIFYADIDRINLILSCDQLTINGITYQNEEIGEAEPITQTDLYKLSVKLTQTNYNYNG